MNILKLMADNGIITSFAEGKRLINSNKVTLNGEFLGGLFGPDDFNIALVPNDKLKVGRKEFKFVGGDLIEKA